MFGRVDMDGGGALTPLVRRLEAEQERWFCWLPVLLGCGIGEIGRASCRERV